jgi:hypothetical protein
MDEKMVKCRRLLTIHERENGQGMTEYVVVAAAIVAGTIMINSIVIPPLNDLYEMISTMLSIPFP